MASSINSDNGVVSGSAGLKSTADTSGVLALQSNGTTALTINTDLSATFAGAVTASSFSGTTTTATNLAGGSNGTIPYQSASGTTQMLAAGTSGQVLTSNGAAAPTWATPAPGAGTVTAVASGALTNGSTVVLNSDGTVSVIAATSASATTSTSITSASSLYAVQGTNPTATASFDPTTNTVVVFYVASSNGYLWSVAGTISGTTITFGSPLNIFGASIAGQISWGFGAVYVPTANRHVVFFSRNSDNYIVSRMVSTSGTGASASCNLISGGSQSIFEGNVFTSARCVYDPTSDKVVVVTCNRDASNSVYACVVTVTSTTVSAGSPVNVMGGGYNHSPNLCLDPTDNKILVIGQGSASYPRAAVGTISGTSISFGSPAIIEFAAGAFYNTCAITYSVADAKVFVAYALETGVSTVRGAIGTVSGTSISFGTPQTFGYGYTSNLPFSAVYYATTGKTYFMQQNIQSRIAISGTAFTVEDPYTYTSIERGTLLYLSGVDLLMAVGPGYFSGTYYPAVATATAYSTNLTSSNFLGFSSAAYTNGQTATISTVGSTITNQSGLTTATKYYVGPTGVLNTSSSQPYAGLAMSATKLVVKG